ncbi:myelocytomatosis oncogene homolog [Oncorhynchus nerka]|uniref:myelocytomatosis oncogene homolog n=1 Tax=Oncorhynchus nerka TaxID=8023 RepID=UPI0011304136|nr:transcriptional regulator Myc-2-like [Oncorhynchus nerka]XP_046168671.1 transcriptional regulator Myc-2-like [Oncorhynchus gorbuscha]
MLQSFSQSQDWFYSEPLLFDDEFCQSLMKDLQSLPTPPQSPPMKAGLNAKPLSKEDQLSYVSDILLEDQDPQLNWNFDILYDGNATVTKDQQPEESDDCLWHCLGDKSMEEKLSSVLSSSPLLSDIDTRIFEEIAGSTLDCHTAALACQALENEDLLLDRHDRQEQGSESTSDYGSAGGEFSTYWSSASDTEEEIDVVTVKRTASPSQLAEESRRQRRAIKRQHLEIQLQHNYAAPCPTSPLRLELSTASNSHHKRSRVSDSHRHHQHGSSGRSSSSRHYLSSHHQSSSSRQSPDMEDEEERRHTHNVMERQRRNELKNCFLRLRDNVPELSNNDKASKVVILKRARDSIRSLELEGQRLNAKRDKLRDGQEQLKAKLEQLRR